MARHVIVGAGPIGSTLAVLLADEGHEVRVVTRSGRTPQHPGVVAARADATDPRQLAAHVAGAVALYNCANPPSYEHWQAQWPPLAQAMLTTAERTGAVLTTMGNLYGYGLVDAPITRDHPLAATSRKGRLRAQLWQAALASHEAGRARVVEVRASDYLGPTTTPPSGLITRYGWAALTGRTAWVFGDPDVPHSWTYVPDVARTLALVATQPRAWGRAWHVPTDPPVTVRSLLSDIAAIGGREPVPVRRVPGAVLAGVGAFVPVVRELREVMYQFERPFIIDATATEAAFGLRPTPWAQVLAETVEGWQASIAAQRG